MNRLQKKANFYKLCEEYGIDTPTTYFYDCKDDSPFTEEMTYPVIIKPSNGIEYYKHPFTGQEKVYRVNTPEETDKVIQMIKNSGYRDELIIQDYIPGDDTYMWDSVLYLNSKSKTELVTFGQVVLQEHTATAIGNYTSVLTRYNEEMMKKLQQFLETVGYVGFANFDIKYDERDGKFKIFEVNIRQGRSSYYVTALGHNMATYIVDDVLHDKEKPTTYLNEEYLFSVVPRIVLNNFVENEAVKQDVKRLVKEKKWGNPLFYKRIELSVNSICCSDKLTITGNIKIINGKIPRIPWGFFSNDSTKFQLGEFRIYLLFLLNSNWLKNVKNWRKVNKNS